MERDGAIALYFYFGLSYMEILCALAVNHQLVISLRTLKRLLRRQGLFRRRNYTDIFDVAIYINEQIHNSGNQHGYRWMQQKCLQSGMVVSREVVYTLMQILDPQGIELRKKRRLRRRHYFAKGPNYLWHVDSYDKLKPFGLCINGCIDGFSRRIIWLNVYHTSSDPRVIAGYYVEAVNELEGCPQLMRGDMGTENGHLARMQEFLSGQDSFLYGKSMHNQRIESFWCILRKECTQFWMDTLKQLKDCGDFTGDAIDTNLVQFCFSNLVQNDLDRVVSVWSGHRIRHSKNQNVPHGRPVVLYSMPELFSTKDYLRAVDQRDVEICEEECLFRDRLTRDPEMSELIPIYMVQHELELVPPNNSQKALDLYHTLRPLVRHDLLV